MTDHINHIVSVFDDYKNNSHRTPEYQAQVVEDALAYCQKTRMKMPELWAIVFASDATMRKSFEVMNVNIMAQEALNNYQSAPHPALLNQIVLTAYVQCRSDDGVATHKAQAWKEVLGEVAGFGELLDHKLQANSFSQGVHLTLPVTSSTMPPPIETLVFKVPLMVRNNFEPTDAPPPMELVNECIESFREMKLQDYMEVSDFVQSSSLELCGEHWHFTFETSRATDVQDMEKLMEALQGQLGDGWGESMEQQEVLVGRDMISVSFDHEKTRLYTPQAKKPKP